MAAFTTFHEGESITLFFDPSVTSISPLLHVTPHQQWKDNIPKPHSSRSIGISIPTQSTTTAENVLYPPGLKDPEDFDLPGVSEERRPFVAQQIRDLLTRWLSVFSLHDNDYGLSNVETLFIELTSDKPVYRKPYNIPFHLRPVIQKQLKDLMSSNIIEPACSPFSAPIVLVKKKDGSIRLCLDFRMLNAITKRDGYPLPRIDTSLALLRGSKVFSAMDLVGGYHQVPVAPQDKEKLAFATPWGQFQISVLLLELPICRFIQPYDE